MSSAADLNVYGQVPPHPEDPGLGPTIMGVSWLLTVVAMVTLALRLHRRASTTKLGWDDWTMVVAGLSHLLFMAFFSRSYHYGMGSYDADLTAGDYLYVMKWIWIAGTPSIVVSIFARISAAILLGRIFTQKTWFKWYLIIYTTIFTLSAILCIICIWIQTQPAQALWNPTIPYIKLENPVFTVAPPLSQGLAAFSDLTYVLFPVIIIWKLNMPLRRKIGLVLILTTSIVTMAICIVRACLSAGVTQLAVNPEYSISIAYLTAAIEQSLLITMGCVPALGHLAKATAPFFQQVVRSLTDLSDKVSSALSRDGSLVSGSRRGSRKGSVEDGLHNDYYNLEGKDGLSQVRSVPTTEKSRQSVNERR